ncbi:unnamed protein product [marine sediment metagenome]|uniref:Uncharacterized protein n=1 Tax=marine sediment metagenome TaxID=412755 RepID=X1DDF3_9ZZZZ
MSDYSIDMFCKDHDEMIPMLRVLKHIEIPESEWPNVNIEGTIYGLNPNNAVADTLGFFKTKYGQSKATDYGWRFLSIIWFINENKGALMKKRLVRDDASGQTIIRDELLQVLLDSFIPPKPPVIFPTTPLSDRRHTFSLSKVLKAVKPLIRD